MKNLIVIVCDTLRALADLPPDPSAPPARFFERLQGSAIALPRLVASSSWTLPSHISLLNGGPPWELYEYDRYPPRFRGQPLSGLWRELGGESVAFSRNPQISSRTGILNDYDAINPGFRAGASLATGQTLWGIDSLTTDLRYRSGRRLPLAEGILDTTSLITGTLARPIQGDMGLIHGVRRYLRSRRGGKPLHIFLNLMACHEPYAPRAAPSGHFPPIWMMAACDLGRVAYQGRFGAGMAEALRAGYARATTQVQHELERLWGDLERYGVLRDSCVLVTSDHGQSLGENGFFGHNRFLHDELVRIPGLLYLGGAQMASGNVPTWGRRPLDLRHLHSVLRELPGVGSEEDLHRSAARALGDRGPAVAYVASKGRLRKAGVDPGPLVRRLKVFSEEADVQLEVEGDQRRRTSRGPEVAVSHLDPLVDSLMRSVPGAAAPRAPVLGSSLVSWGYE